MIRKHAKVGSILKIAFHSKCNSYWKSSQWEVCFSRKSEVVLDQFLSDPNEKWSTFKLRKNNKRTRTCVCFCCCNKYFLSLLQILMSVLSEKMTATTFAPIQLGPIVVPAEVDIFFTRMERLV